MCCSWGAHHHHSLLTLHGKYFLGSALTKQNLIFLIHHQSVLYKYFRNTRSRCDSYCLYLVGRDGDINRSPANTAGQTVGEKMPLWWAVLTRSRCGLTATYSTSYFWWHMIGLTGFWPGLKYMYYNKLRHIPGSSRLPTVSTVTFMWAGSYT